MRKFILTGIIFSIGLFGLATFIDYVITKQLRKSTSQMLASWNDIYSGELQSDVVIMGNSRAWSQYSPVFLDSILGVNSYNLGFDGSPINRQIIKYDAYRRYNNKPQYIIQNIDFITIDIGSGYERQQFFPYFFDDSLIIDIYKYESFGFWEKVLPVYRYFGYPDLMQKAIMPYYKYISDGNMQRGYYGKDFSWDGSALAKQGKIIYSQDSLALHLFDEYLAKAYSEGVKVIFVYAPSYIAATEKIKNIEGMYEMYDSIARKYNIPILDYNYAPISYDTTYFYNAIHLNKKGAEFFSTILAHDIDSLGILIEKNASR